jgi:fibronectin-binding autotransporter adhesin
MKSNKSPRFSTLTKIVFASLVLAASAAPSRAANGADTWTGASATWSTAGNWSAASANKPPISNDSLVFGAAGAGGTTLNNDLTNTSFNIAGITFNAGASAFTIGGNAFVLTGNVANNGTNLETINDAFSFTAVRTFTTTTGGGNLSLGGVVSGAGGITKAGTGTLTVSGANTYTGATTVTAGTLKAGVASVANVSGAFGKNSAVSLSNVAGVTLDITGFNTQIGSLAVGGTTGGNVTLGAATLTTGGNNTSTSYAGIISGAGGGLTKIGTGTQTLTGVNTYTGATTVSAGELSVSGAGKVGNAGAIAISSGATLDYNSTAAQTLAGVISGAGALIQEGTATLTISGSSNTFTGTTTIGGGSALAFTGSGLASGTVVFAGNNGDSTLTSNTTSAVSGITIGSGLLATVSETTAAGKTFTLGSITRSGAGSMLEITPTAGTSTYTTTSIGTSGILGPWAYTGTGTTLAYAVGSSSGAATTITGLTGTAATANLANVTSATGNYAYSSTTGASPTQAGSVTANTLQFTGTGVNWNNGGNNIILNGLMNSSSGTLTESGSGTIMAGTAGGELDIVTNTQGITLGSAIVDNTSASALAFASIGNTGTLTLTGVNTYTGATYINSGAINYNSTGAQTLSGVISGDGTLVQSGPGTLIIANAGGFQSTGAIAINNGATLQLGNTASAFNAGTAPSLIFTGSGGTVTDGTTLGSTIALSGVYAGPTVGASVQIAPGATGTIGAGVTAVAANAFIGGTTGTTTLPGNLGVLNIAGTYKSTTTNINVVNAIVNVVAGGSLISASQIQTGSGSGAPLPGGFDEFVNISGGTAIAPNGIVIQNGQSTQASYSAFTLGYGGTGGSINLGGALSFGRAGNTGNAYFYLDSGTLTATTVTAQVVGANSQNAFFFNGGTLKTSSSTTIMNGTIGAVADSAPPATVGDTAGTGTVTNTLAGGGGVYIGGTNGVGGAVIDTNGFNDIVAQSLLTGSGIWGSTAYTNGSTPDGGLTKLGSGTLTLSGANTYTGATTVSQGTVQLASGGTLGATTAALAISGSTAAPSTLDLNGINATVGAVTLGSTGSTSSTIADGTFPTTTAAATLTTGGVTVNGTGNTINAGATVVGAVGLTGAALADNGGITGTVTVGTGTLTGSGLVTGAVGVTGGTITGSGLTWTGGATFNSTGNTLSGTDTGNVSVASGGALSQTGTLTGNMSVASGGALSQTGTLIGSVSNSGTSTFSGVIAGSGTFTNVAGTSTVTGANTYSGGTTISSGTVELISSGVGSPPPVATLGSINGTLTVNGGTLDIEGTAGNYSTNNNVGILNVGALNGTGGTITNLGLSTGGNFSNLTVGNGNASGSYAGAIMDGGELISLTKVGTGTQVLSGNSQYSDGTTITGGILSISSEANIGDTANYFSGRTLGLTLGGGELLTTATTPLVEGVTLNSGTTNTLAATTGTTATYSGSIVDATSSIGALTVGDSNGNNGTVSLSNATGNTYSGGTTVSSGTLLADGGTITRNASNIVTATSGSATGSGAVEVKSGATLGGSGVIGGNLKLDNGAKYLSSDVQTGPNATPGMVVQNLDASAGNVTLTFYLGNSAANATPDDFAHPVTTASSFVTVLGTTAGEIAFNSSDTINLVDLSPGSLKLYMGTTYLLMTAGNGTELANDLYSGLTTTGGFDSNGNLLNGYVTNLNLSGSAFTDTPNVELYLYNGELEAVPEPSTWALMLGGLVLLIVIQRRRKLS